jgi:hypothetical protein
MHYRNCGATNWNTNRRITNKYPKQIPKQIDSLFHQFFHNIEQFVTQTPVDCGIPQPIFQYWIALEIAK